jgi:hypothetical protein
VQVKLQLFVFCAAAAIASPAQAACPDTRPTSAGAPYAFDAPVQTFDTEHVRVHFATTGPNAVRDLTAPGETVPDDVKLVGDRTEQAFTAYAAKGFRLPLADTRQAPCSPGGGDARLDVYLVAFQSADGATVTERCAAAGTCNAYIIADARLDRRYPTVDEGVRTVLPHELFHAVQYAYSGNLTGFFSEGSAQWAAANLSGSDADLRKFLPDFFRETGRPLDVPPAGATAGYLYGAAIWSVFLAETYGESLIRATLEFQAADRMATTLAATDLALQSKASSMKDAFGTFALYNLATGKRAGPGGYAQAATYPMASVANLSATADPAAAAGTLQAESAISGYAAKYYRVSGPGELRLYGNPDEVTTLYAPRADSSEAPLVDQALRTSSTGPQLEGAPIAVTSAGGYVVVAGARASKRDATFRIVLTPPVAQAPEPTPTPQPTPEPTTQPGPIDPTPSDPVSPKVTAAPVGSSSGCSAGALGAKNGSESGMLIVLLGCLVARRLSSKERRKPIL